MYSKDQSGFLAFDLDGTILKCNSSFSFYFFGLKQGFFPCLSIFVAIFQLIRKKIFCSYNRWSQITFNKLLKGYSKNELQDLAFHFVEKELHKLYYSPVKLVLDKALKEKIPVVILSAGPDFLVEAIAKKIGVKIFFGTTCREDSTGKLIAISCFMNGQQKALVVQQFIKNGQECLQAFADDIDDLPFLRLAKKAVVVQPKRSLKKEAMKWGWSLL
ncbi:HAD family hydrolase [Candidatus Clavichlamydia salmonicola]|uniref:HAD family hydrolase n=1 Tax=Candidatus Clavichlamydia salmonicola TaxID=469812 RepID=UPI0018913C46|nr:HAD family hydrolase [Candidatus Clavichlamydia salmonicola]